MPDVRRRVIAAGEIWWGIVGTPLSEFWGSQMESGAEKERAVSAEVVF